MRPWPVRLPSSLRGLPRRAAVILRALALLAAVASVGGCSAVRWVRDLGSGRSEPSPCAPPPRSAPPPPPPAESCPPPTDLGPVIPAPPPTVADPAPPPPLSPLDLEPPAAPEDEGRTLPGTPSDPLPPMQPSTRPPWSAATDPDLRRLPAAVDVAATRPWTVIVVHHSATRRGGAALFDKDHRAKGWEGVGYDFVIGNGTDTGDGELEVTFRWREQRDGAHVKGWNEVSIGICLVGNFEETDPTPAQRATLETLLRHLRRRFGIPPERIVGHKTLNPTACPGRRLLLPPLLSRSAP